MRFGKKSLAGLASGALLLSGLALVAAQPAQAISSASVYCSGGTADTIPGSAGTAGDPTTVVGGCSVPSGSATNFATLTTSNNVFPGATWLWINTSGTADVDPTGANWTAGVNYAQINTQTIVVNPAAFDATTTVSVLAGTAGPSNTTVTVRASTLPNTAPSTISAGNTFADSTFEIQFYGTAVAAVIDPFLAAIPPQFDNIEALSGALSPSNGALNDVWIGAVGAVDAAGNLVPLNPAGSNTPTTVGLQQTPDQNIDRLTLTGVPVAVSGAPLVSGNDPFFVGVLSNGATIGGANNQARVLGTNNYTVRLLPTLPNLTASSSYVVSNTLAGSYTASFDKAEYNRGEMATLTVCANDLGGRIVPDTLGWGLAGAGAPIERDLGLQFSVETVVPFQPLVTGSNTNFEVSSVVASINTVAGCQTYNIRMPGQNVDFTVALTPATTGTGMTRGWAAGTTGPASLTVKVGDGSGPTPTPATILIVGERGKGAEANRVFVEGTTTGFGAIGGQVTPFFRFPGQTGFTQGTGVRSVDAEGNFAWQRKTGKRISVQFRAGDVRSNTVIIAAK